METMKVVVFAKTASTTPKVSIVTSARTHSTDRKANNGMNSMYVDNVIAIATT